MSLKKYRKCRSVQSIIGASETGYGFGILAFFSDINGFDTKIPLRTLSVKNPLFQLRLGTQNES
ncbi:hypothetical protein LEP1GSC175_3275 [Leptospira santarosai str. HAI821]|nr:hypothetical protein LEP1GSC175_3275 [Leptospira santarosai str. HAI821]